MGLPWIEDSGVNHSPPVCPQSWLGTASPLVLLLCAPILFGCAVTQIMTDVDSNPLPTIAERAAERYTVTWLDKQTLEVTDDWDSTLTFQSRGCNIKMSILAY